MAAGHGSGSKAEDAGGRGEPTWSTFGRPGRPGGFFGGPMGSPIFEEDHPLVMTNIAMV